METFIRLMGSMRCCGAHRLNRLSAGLHFLKAWQAGDVANEGKISCQIKIKGWFILYGRRE